MNTPERTPFNKNEPKGNSKNNSDCEDRRCQCHESTLKSRFQNHRSGPDEVAACVITSEIADARAQPSAGNSSANERSDKTNRSLD
jgi:hypothetical protein